MPSGESLAHRANAIPSKLTGKGTQRAIEASTVLHRNMTGMFLDMCCGCDNMPICHTYKLKSALWEVKVGFHVLAEFKIWPIRYSYCCFFQIFSKEIEIHLVHHSNLFSFISLKPQILKSARFGKTSSTIRTNLH